MRIFTNLSLGFAIFVVYMSGVRHVRGDKVFCASTPPGAHQVQPGSVLNLTCLSGTGRLLVWSKNGKTITDNVRSVQIPGSKVKLLVTSIKNASTVDSGRYECRDEGGASQDACEWKLDVFAPPYIKLISPAYEHLEGADLFIECRASGYPPPVYKWLFNGNKVKSIKSTLHDSLGESAGLKVINNYGKSFLKIVWADTGFSGNYTCIANNSRGQDEKSTALLFRNFPTPVVHTAKYIVFKERQQNIILRCMATDIFKTQTTVTWYHNNDRLFNHKEQFFSNKTVASRLMIHNASDEDVGIYWCDVKVFGLIKKSRTRLIQAKEGLPLVSTENPIVISRLGDRLTLSCSVTYPRYDVITISWTKNNSILAHSYTSRDSPKETREKHSEMFTFYLSIKNFTLDDAGTFVCRVESMTGTNWTSIEVKIQKQIVHDQYSSEEPRVSTPSLVSIFLVAALGSIFAIVTAITIRYLYRLRNKKLAARYKNSSSSQEYRYETFLSFSNHDYKWVTTHLVPLLDKYSFKYCITRKDFEVGKAMIENIADSIYQSRTVIAIVSENFMVSKHCQQELDLALYKSAELDDGSLIVIRIDSIQKGLLPKALRNRTFLDYADTEERKHWERRLLKCLFSHTRNITTEMRI